MSRLIVILNLAELEMTLADYLDSPAATLAGVRSMLAQGKVLDSWWYHDRWGSAQLDLLEELARAGQVPLFPDLMGRAIHRPSLLVLLLDRLSDPGMKYWAREIVEEKNLTSALLASLQVLMSRGATVDLPSRPELAWMRIRHRQDRIGRDVLTADLGAVLPTVLVRYMLRAV